MFELQLQTQNSTKSHQLFFLIFRLSVNNKTRVNIWHSCLARTQTNVDNAIYWKKRNDFEQPNKCIIIIKYHTHWYTYITLIEKFCWNYFRFWNTFQRLLAEKSISANRKKKDYWKGYQRCSSYSLSSIILYVFDAEKNILIPRKKEALTLNFSISIFCVDSRFQ